jgi:hypothetical protein
VSTKFDSSLFVDVASALGLGKAAKHLVASVIALKKNFYVETAPVALDE